VSFIYISSNYLEHKYSNIKNLNKYLWRYKNNHKNFNLVWVWFKKNEIYAIRNTIKFNFNFIFRSSTTDKWSVVKITIKIDLRTWYYLKSKNYDDWLPYLRYLHVKRLLLHSFIYLYLFLITAIILHYIWCKLKLIL
jgi:hypothetical protein